VRDLGRSAGRAGGVRHLVRHLVADRLVGAERFGTSAGEHPGGTSAVRGVWHLVPGPPGGHSAVTRCVWRLGRATSAGEHPQRGPSAITRCLAPRPGTSSRDHPTGHLGRNEVFGTWSGRPGNAPAGNP